MESTHVTREKHQLGVMWKEGGQDTRLGTDKNVEKGVTAAKAEGRQGETLSEQQAGTQQESE